MADTAVTKLVAYLGFDGKEFEEGLSGAETAFVDTVHKITDTLDEVTGALNSVNESGASITPKIDPKPIDEHLNGLDKVKEATKDTAAEADRLDRAVRRVGNDIQNLPNAAGAGLAKMQSMFSNTIQNLIGKVSGPLTAAFTALMSGAAVSQYLNQADSIGKLSESIGINIEDMQAWGEAVERAGGNAQGFQQTVKGLNQRLQQVVSGAGGEIQKTLQGIGVSATDANGKARDTLDVLRDLAEKSESMDKQKFVGLAQKLGIDHGTIMLLQSGKMSLDELIKRQKALGVYTKEDAEIAAKANDAMADLQQVLKAFAAIIARVIVPGITFLTEKLTSAVVYIKDHKEFVITAILAVATAITASMIPALAGMARAALAAIAPFAPFIAAGAALALVIDDLVVYIEGGESALSDLWSVFGTGPEIAQSLSTAWEELKTVGTALFNALLDGVKQFFQNFKLAFSGLADMVKGVFQIIKGIITGDMDTVVTGLKTLLSGYIDWAIGIVQGAITTINNAFIGLANLILGLFGKTWDDITNGLIAAFEHAKDAVLNIFRSVVDTIAGWIKGLVDMIPSMDGIKSMASGAADTVKGWFGFGGDTPKVATSITPMEGQKAANSSVPAIAMNNDNKQVDQSQHTSSYNATFNISGAESPEATARAVDERMRRSSSLAARSDTGVNP